MLNNQIGNWFRNFKKKTCSHMPAKPNIRENTDLDINSPNSIHPINEKDNYTHNHERK